MMSLRFRGRGEGSGDLSRFVQITAQINTLAPADPEQTMPPESRPSGPHRPPAPPACHDCQRSARRAAAD